MSPLSPFAALTYADQADDLVRYRADPVDDSLSPLVRSIFDGLDARRDEVRAALAEGEVDTLLIFARRRLVRARAAHDARALCDALDADALVARVSDVPWESWFKATLFVARELGLDLDDVAERLVRGASASCAARATVAFDALARVEELSQCHVVAVTTTYGPGLVETTVVRDQTGHHWGGLTSGPVRLGQFQVNYAPTTNLAQLAVDVADALDATTRVTCSPLRQDQLVATMFDLVTSGSYVDSLGCFSFFADSLEGGPDFSVTIAEVGAEEYDDLRYEAEELAADLAAAADAIEEQAAFSFGSCVVVLSALPDFSEDTSEEPADLSPFLDVARRAVTTP